MYFSASAAHEALERRGMFNVIHSSQGWKADLIIRKNRPFSIEEFSRKIRTPITSGSAWAVTPEDSILSKLEWCKDRSIDNQQFKDVLDIIRAHMKKLDFEYLRRWAKKLAVLERLEQAIKIVL